MKRASAVCCGWVLVLVGLSVLSPVAAQAAETPDEPIDVAIRDAKGRPQVGQLLAYDRNEGAAFVLRPDGTITPERLADLKPSNTPFAPLGFNEIEEELLAGEFQGFKTRRTKRYLYVYQCSDQFQVLVSRILETMYSPLKAYFQRERIPTEEPPFPMVVVIFRTHDDMRQYKDLPPSVVAFYETLSNRVILAEQTDLVRDLPELGVPQAFSTIAHEGVHQILHNIGVQRRLSRWPAWISEGLAEYFAPCEIRDNGAWKGVGKRNDLRMLELTQFPAPNPARTTNTLTEQTVLAPRLASAGYATSWALTHFLAERRKRQFIEYLREVAQTKPLEYVEPADDLVRFKRYLGADLFEIEVGVYKHILSLRNRR